MAELPVQIVAVGVVLMSARADGWFNVGATEIDSVVLGIPAVTGAPMSRRH